ncbi:MAG: Flp pilus assembly complex ATPase component [bacterium]|nr:Flp pilus assembly complex ATPase component [bacterium]
MQKNKIGDIFVKCGLISPDALKRALMENRKHPKEKLGRTLVRMNITSHEEVAGVLSRQSNIPYIDLNMVVIDPSAVQKVPAETAMKHHILPIYVEKNNLVLAVEDPYDFEAVEAARFASGLNIRPHVASFSDIAGAIQRYHSLNVTLKARSAQSAQPNDDLDFILKHVGTDDVHLEELREQSESAAVENMLNTVIFQAIAMRADAILFEPEKTHLQIKNRINGALSNGTKVPKSMQKALLAHIKIMAGMDFAKRMIPQKGRTQYHMQQRSLELEVSCLPAQHGESMIVQILDSGESVPLINDLGLQSEDMMKALKLLSVPNGMVLVCGPPGSGQIATVYALAHELSRHQRKIVTIEDSIEYQLKGAQQVQVKEAGGLSFAKALESVLRQNPEAIVLGDVRDKDTAEMAMKASQEGHLVLGVVRSRNIIAAISELIGLGVSAKLVAASLSGIITQRTVRQSCPHCREQYRPMPGLLRRVEAKVNENPRGDFHRGKGCKSCNYSGFHERFSVYYIALMSQAMARIIQQDVTKSGIGRIESALLAKSILAKVKQGETTLEELERVILRDGRPQRAPEAEAETEVRQTPAAPAQKAAAAPQAQPVQKVQPAPAAPAAPTQKTAAASQAQPVQKAQPVPAAPAAPKKAPAQKFQQPQQKAKTAPQAQAQAASPQGRPPATVRYQASNCKILIVDPDQKIKQHIGKALIEKNFQVLSAADGVDALKKIIKEQPNLVITESVLPKLDGLNLIRRLRKAEATNSIPVIIVSSKGEIADRIRGFAAGSDDYVPKPFSIHELFFRINAVLRRTYSA